MKLRVLSFLIGMMCCSAVYGQYDPYEYYYNNSGPDDVSKEISTDDDLFFIPLSGGKDIFTRVSAFNFSAVRYFRRGYPMAFDITCLGNIDISRGISSSADYSLTTALRRSGFSEHTTPGLKPGHSCVGSVNGVKYYMTDISMLEQGGIASVSSTNRKGRLGGKLYSAGSLPRGWNYAASVTGRWGRDAAVDGVFTDEISFMAAVDKSLGKDGRLTFLFLGTSGESGSRSYATQEAFGLAGDNYYNPSWGDYNGRQRSAKVAKRFLPFTMLAYEGNLSEYTRMTVSAAYRFGRSSYSALSWFRADNPFPDYYRNMPSYADNPAAAQAIRDKWMADKSVWQVRWGDMYGQNLNNKDGSSYLLEDRVEDVGDLQLAVSAVTVFDKYTELSYGARARFDNTHFYKRAKDLLGGRPFEDVDQFLDDYPYDGVRHNNMRDPGRRVGKGDRFGYNYNINGSGCEAFAIVNHSRERFTVAGSLGIGRTSFRRDGHYEKELFPGKASYGESEKLDFDTYNIKASAGYYFSPLHSLLLTGGAAAAAPEYGTVFLSPVYSNSVTDRSRTVKAYAAEAEYRFQYKDVSLRICGYYTVTKDEAAVYRYYDDIAAKYSDMILEGIGKCYYGAELAASYDFTPRLSVTAAGAVGRNTYVSDPDVDIFEDATQTKYVTGAKSYLDGFRTGGSPETVASIELSYRARGWMASATYAYMGGRYVVPNPLWRMERAYNLASSPERYREFVSQEKLPDARTLGVFILKSFYFSDTRLTAMLSVNNLLGGKEIIYNGYEQMRVMKRGGGVNRDYAPFDRKYLYSYGRTYYCSLTYRF